MIKKKTADLDYKTEVRYEIFELTPEGHLRLPIIQTCGREDYLFSRDFMSLEEATAAIEHVSPRDQAVYYVMAKLKRTYVVKKQ